MGIIKWKPLSQALALPDSHDLETDVPQFLSVEEQASIEYEGGLVHAGVDGLPVEFAEFGPLSGDNNGFDVFAGVHCS